MSPDYYTQFLSGTDTQILFGETYRILSHADAAMVTSGTATLETALFRVPQVVCYKTPIPKVIAFLRRRLLKVKYISLVNLIANREVVSELVADTFSEDNIAGELAAVTDDGKARDAMLRGYAEVKEILGEKDAADNAAREMLELLGG